MNTFIELERYDILSDAAWIAGMNLIGKWTMKNSLVEYADE